MLSKVIDAPLSGFTVSVRQEVIDRDMACNVLTPLLQQKITSAEHKGTSIVITRHFIECPRCGSKIPAYEKFLNPENTSVQTYIRNSSFIERWASNQIELFSKEQPQFIAFNTPVTHHNEFICPKCKLQFLKSKGTVKVIISSGRKKIKVSRKLSLKDMLSIRWTDSRISLCSFEIYETVTFNLRNGHTFVSIENEQGRRLKVRDISNVNVDFWQEDPIFNLISNCKPVYREIKRQFIRILKSPLPFAAKDLTPQKFILMTAFVGYNSDFYDSLPFDSEGALINESFLKIARKLHYAKNIPNMLKKTTLPNVKSMRRIFFGSPGLLLYTEELEKFWELIGNIDLFRKFTQSDSAFKELLYLKRCPVVFSFYRDYKLTLGITALLKLLSLNYRVMCKRYIADYLLLSEKEKKRERRKWEKDPIGYIMERKMYCFDNGISVPVLLAEEETAKSQQLECCIKGYSFRRLKNSMEYMQAGRVLHNCLEECWNVFDGNVYAIKRFGKYVGAVEIKDNKILQAFAARNEDLKNDKPLFEAFKIWRTNNSLIYDRRFV